MNSGLKKVVYILIIFGFLAIGTEALRYIKIHIALNASLENMAKDSIELAIKDEFRQEHVSVIDTDICKRAFLTQVKETYRLDGAFNPPVDSYIKDFEIEQLELSAGEYETGINRLLQREEPTLYAKGYITVKPLILGVNSTVNIPFELNTRNSRR